MTGHRGSDDSGFQVWRKSSRSGQQSMCVEVSAGHGTVGVRDSKDPQGPYLAVSAEQWTAFLNLVQN